MNREEVTLLGFENCCLCCDARSKLLEALKAAEAGDFAKADSLVEEAGSCNRRSSSRANKSTNERSSR